MAVNIAGLIVLVVFYLVILIVGVFAARRKGLTGRPTLESSIVADRNISTLVGIFTMTGWTLCSRFLRALFLWFELELTPNYQNVPVYSSPTQYIFGNDLHKFDRSIHGKWKIMELYHICLVIIVCMNSFSSPIHNVPMVSQCLCCNFWDSNWFP